MACMAAAPAIPIIPQAAAQASTVHTTNLDAIPAGPTRIQLIQNDYGDVVASYLSHTGVGTKALSCLEFDGLVLDRLPVGVMEPNSDLERVYGVNQQNDWVKHLNARHTPKNPPNHVSPGVVDYWQYNSNWRDESGLRVPRGFIAPELEFENNFGQLRPSDIPDAVKYVPGVLSLPFVDSSAGFNQIVTRTHEVNDGTLFGTKSSARYQMSHFVAGTDRLNEVLIYVSVPSGLPGDVTFNIDRIPNTQDAKADPNARQSITMQAGHHLIRYMPTLPAGKHFDSSFAQGNSILEFSYTIKNNGQQSLTNVRYAEQQLSNQEYTGRNVQAAFAGLPVLHLPPPPGDEPASPVNPVQVTKYYYGGVKILVGSTIYPENLPTSNAFMVSGYGYGFSGYGAGNTVQFPGQFVSALPGKVGEVWVAFRAGDTAPFVMTGVPYSDLRTDFANGDIDLVDVTDRTPNPDVTRFMVASWPEVNTIASADAGGTAEILYYTLTPFIDTNPDTKNSGAYPPNTIVIPRQLVDDLESITCQGFVTAPGFTTVPSAPQTLSLVSSQIPPEGPTADVIRAFNITIRDLFPGGVGVVIPAGNYSDTRNVPYQPNLNPEGTVWRSVNPDGSDVVDRAGNSANFINFRVPLGFTYKDFTAMSIFNRHPEIPDCRVVNTQTLRETVPTLLAVVPSYESISGSSATSQFGVTDGNPVDGRTFLQTSPAGFPVLDTGDFVGNVVFTARENERVIHPFTGRQPTGTFTPVPDSSHFDNYMVNYDLGQPQTWVSGAILDDRIYGTWYNPRGPGADDFNAVLQITGRQEMDSSAYELKCDWGPPGQPTVVLNEFPDRSLRLVSPATTPLYLTLLNQLENENPLGLGDLSFGGLPLVLVIVTFMGYATFNKKHLPSAGIGFFLMTAALWWFQVISLPETALAAILFVVVILIFQRGLKS